MRGCCECCAVVNIVPPSSPSHLISCDEQERCVHHSRAVEHRSHQNIVPGAVDETDVATELVVDAVFGEGVGVGGTAGGVRAGEVGVLVFFFDF